MNYEEIYRSHPDVFRKFADVMRHDKNFFEQLSSLGFFNNMNRLLSIGGGEGALEKELLRKFPKATLDFIEPSLSFLNRFKESLSDTLKERVNLHGSLFQDFNADEPYSHILAIHSWYGIGFHEESLRKALSLLSPSGRFATVLVSKESPLWTLHVNYCNPLPDFHAEGFHQWATSLGYKSQFFKNERKLPWRNLFQEGRFTDHGYALLMFTFQRFKDEITPEMLEAALAHFERKVYNGMLYLEAGITVFDNALS